MSKSLATSGKGATEDCDYLDLWQIHALKDPEDADNRVKAGVLDACCRFR